MHPPPSTPPLYTVAGRSGNDIILKAVNPTPEPQPAKLKLSGVTNLAPKAAAITLSGTPPDENSLNNPTKIIPQSREIDASTNFQYTFPQNSVTILRFHGAP